MNNFFRTGVIFLASMLASASVSFSETTAVTINGQSSEELMPGLLVGFLSKEEQIDSRVFVLPAPPPASGHQKLDDTWAAEMQSLRGSARWDLAATDADLSFPSASDRFSCALGIQVSEETTPDLYVLLYRSMTDLGLSSYAAKNKYQRERPFMVTDTPTCTPDDEELLRIDGSYPSGHTAIGWGWALLLSELFPERTEDIIARGRSYGESRNVCNVHWYSDVVAGRMTSAAAVAKLHTSPEFTEAMALAKADIARARAEGITPVKDCALERSILNINQ